MKKLSVKIILSLTAVLIVGILGLIGTAIFLSSTTVEKGIRSEFLSYAEFNALKIQGTMTAAAKIANDANAYITNELSSGKPIEAVAGSPSRKSLISDAQLGPAGYGVEDYLTRRWRDV